MLHFQRPLPEIFVGIVPKFDFKFTPNAGNLNPRFEPILSGYTSYKLTIYDP